LASVLYGFCFINDIAIKKKKKKKKQQQQQQQNSVQIFIFIFIFDMFTKGVKNERKI
jgi:hypothetical protein